MYIANSQVGYDKNKGDLTCKYNSTLDYLLASEMLNKFEVDFCNLYSDVHNPVSFSLSSSTQATDENHSTVKLWCTEKRFEEQGTVLAKMCPVFQGKFTLSCR
jgi:hypothetical protein